MPNKVSPIFDPQAFLATINRGRTVTIHRKNGVIFRQTAAADAVFYVMRGRVKIAVTSKQGKEAVVGIMGPTDFFGEGCLIGQPLRLATAKAMVECEIMRIDKTEMMRLLHEESTFAELFMKHLLTRNSRVEEDLVDQLFNSSEKRLARTLLLLHAHALDERLVRETLNVLLKFEDDIQSVNEGLYGLLSTARGG